MAMDPETKSELRVLSDYLGAVRVVRKARTLLLLVVTLSLLSHVGGYCLARWGRVAAEEISEARKRGTLQIPRPVDTILDGPLTTTASTTAPTTSGPAGSADRAETQVKLVKPAAGTDSEVQGDRPGDDIFAEEFLSLFLPVSRFAGMAAGVLLIMTYFLGVNVCLAGRMGGICHATSAFFWSIVVVALMFPWRHLVPGGAIELPDAYFTVEQIRQGLAGPLDDTLTTVLHYGRFVGCPVLAFLAAIVSGVRFGLAYRQVRNAVEPLVQMKVV